MAAARILGIFTHVDSTVRAIRNLRTRGFTNFSAYLPVPLEEIETALEEGRPVSPVRLFTLIGALTGTVTGFALTIWTSLKWDLVTGGKPVVSIPPFVIIAFELTILLGGLSSLLAILVLGKLPSLRRSPTYDPRFTVDRFGIVVTCAPDRVDAVRKCLQDAGAEEVRQ